MMTVSWRHLVNGSPPIEYLELLLDDESHVKTFLLLFDKFWHV